MWQSHVFPKDYTPPIPKKHYDLVVIGGGTAGLVTAAGAAGLGADVALLESHAMGGDCLNSGCVPSKALIAGAKQFHQRQPAELHLEGKSAFIEIMTRMREKRSHIAANDSVRRFTELGVDVFLAQGKFIEHGVIAVGELTLRYKKAVIATGARASAPPVPGLADTPFLTNENLFELDNRPDRLTIIGAGPIGVEMAQAFQRLGTSVQIVEAAPGILIREDRNAATIIEAALRREGVEIFTGVTIEQVTGTASRQLVHLNLDGKQMALESDSLLVAAGRKPNTENLGLHKVGVRLNQQGWIEVDDRLRTSNLNIFSCGDVSSPLQFTHAADFLARTVLQNSLFFGRKKASSLLVPWVTYTAPEIAHVGAYRHELESDGISYVGLSMDFSEVDRAILEDQSGFCEILVKPGKGKILGATIVHEQAGEMISEITLAMQHGIGLGKLAGVIHPYPTQMEIIRKLGDAFNRTRLTPFTARILKFILKL